GFENVAAAAFRSAQCIARGIGRAAVATEADRVGSGAGKVQAAAARKEQGDRERATNVPVTMAHGVPRSIARSRGARSTDGQWATVDVGALVSPSRPASSCDDGVRSDAGDVECGGNEFGGAPSSSTSDGAVGRMTASRGSSTVKVLPSPSFPDD